MIPPYFCCSVSGLFYGSGCRRAVIGRTRLRIREEFQRSSGFAAARQLIATSQSEASRWVADCNSQIMPNLLRRIKYYTWSACARIRENPLRLASALK